jgi:hypothetical protein
MDTPTGTRIQLPNKWRPREYQKPLFHYLTGGGKRAIAVWHRRAGKDDVILHWTAIAASERVGGYWHCMPEYEQCRRSIWNAINPHTGLRRIDEAFPHEIRESTNESQMMIRFHNQSTWQLIGSDNYNAQMGASVVGIAYSEWALAHPGAWAYHRPILEENGGWAAFITTPRGRNHAKAMYDMACATPGWFAERLTVADTKALSPEQLEGSLREYQALFGRDVGTSQFQQEYYVDFNSSVLGAFYALEMLDVRRERRVSELVTADPERPVHRAWDIGVRHDTAIWWFQMVGGQLFILDVYGANNVGVEHYAGVIEARRKTYGWRDGNDYVPHDAKVKEWGIGRTRVESMQTFGLNPMLVRGASKQDGIEALRRTLPLCVFHPRCEEVGLAALEQYHRKWDEELKAYSREEEHDWTSHYADAARYMALAWEALPVIKAPEPKRTGWFIPPPDDQPIVRRYEGMKL